MASGLLKSRGRKVDTRCVNMGEGADELASWRGAVPERLEIWMRRNERQMRPAKLRNGQGAQCEGASSLARTR
jgi:hypothetical protein